MDDNSKNGGAAFPTMGRDEVWNEFEGRHIEKLFPVGGMSLRDYFAAKAMPELIRLSQSYTGEWDCVAVAAGAYQVADAMLKAREGR